MSTRNCAFAEVWFTDGNKLAQYTQKYATTVGSDILHIKVDGIHVEQVHVHLCFPQKLCR